jgi:hypothetical protein
VDGDTTGVGEGHAVVKIDDPQPPADERLRTVWWQVDLGRRQPIGYVQVWPGTDGCCPDRLHNFFVYVSDRELTARDPRELQAQPEVSRYFVLGRAGAPTTIDVRRQGRYVRIQAAYAAQMDLAEVQVWSDPSVATTR